MQGTTCLDLKFQRLHPWIINSSNYKGEKTEHILFLTQSTLFAFSKQTNRSTRIAHKPLFGCVKMKQGCGAAITVTLWRRTTYGVSKGTWKKYFRVEKHLKELLRSYPLKKAQLSWNTSALKCRIKRIQCSIHDCKLQRIGWRSWAPNSFGRFIRR